MTLLEDASNHFGIFDWAFVNKMMLILKGSKK